MPEVEKLNSKQKEKESTQDSSNEKPYGGERAPPMHAAMWHHQSRDIRARLHAYELTGSECDRLKVAQLQLDSRHWMAKAIEETHSLATWWCHYVSTLE